MVERSLDPLEREIIAILQRDARTPSREIAKRLGTSDRTVRRRIERLINEGIMRISAVVDPFKIGMGVVAFIHLDVDLSNLEAAAEYLRSMPCVRYVAYATGRHDMLIEVVFRSQQDLSDFWKGALAKVPGVLRSDTSIQLEILKRVDEWVLPNSTDGQCETKSKQRSE